MTYDERTYHLMAIMKMDMHCHTSEGSLDSHISIAEYIDLLMENGIQGMLVTDHNSYKGYRYWADHKKDMPKGFIVLKGIEYDTIDAGHILVILPSSEKVPLLEVRGMPVGLLVDIVHRHGGILGPAHPCGERFLSLTNNRRFRKQKTMLERFDFVEVFNSCEPEDSNEGAKLLADAYDKPGFGGSDSHRANCVGSAYTCFDEIISTEDELIKYVKAGRPTSTGGYQYHGTTREKMGKMSVLYSTSFWIYNRSTSLAKRHKRRKELKKDDARALAQYDKERGREGK